MAETSVPCTRVQSKHPEPNPVRVTPLEQVFARLSDWRKARGKVYPLVTLLVVVLTGLLCGQLGPTAIAEWCAALPFLTRVAMGLPLGRSPSPMMLCRLLWKLDPEQLETVLRLWISEVNSQLARKHHPARIPQTALDGKAQRGAAKRGAQNAHLLTAISQELKTVLAEVPVDCKTNEITQVSTLLKKLVIEGHLLTMDALLTQREIAQEILDGKAHYLMLAKDNQPSLTEAIAICFAEEPLVGEIRGTAVTQGKDHGRWEVREIVTSTALNGYLDWPGVQQVLRITRTVTKLSTGETSTEIVYGVTSLPPELGSPDLLLAANRGHWAIESTFWVRDTVLGEDACAVHKERSSQTLAALRNVVLALILLTGATSFAQAIRRYAARPIRAVRTIRATGGL